MTPSRPKGEPITPTAEQVARAEDRLPSAEWFPLPMAAVERPDVNALTPAQFGHYVRAMLYQFRFGGLPTEAAALARVLGCPVRTAPRLLEVLHRHVTADGEIVAGDRYVAAQRAESVQRFARAIAKAEHASNSRWGNATPMLGGCSEDATSIPSGNATVHDNNVVGVGSGGAADAAALQEAARVAVRAGLVITPLAVGAKVPQRGQSQRWIDAEPFDWPEGANLGYQPGRSGFLEVDVDSPEGEAIAAELGCFAEPTFTVRTPRAVATAHPKHFANACRLRFRLPAGVAFGKVRLRGTLEVFGGSGYVVLPPSWSTEHGAGWEVVDDAPALECPPRLAETLRRHATLQVARNGTDTRDGWPIVAALEGRLGHRLELPCTVRCPAHDDSTPSLSLKLGTDGSPVFVCGAGCDYRAIVTALGLSPSDLYQRTAA